MKSRDGSNRLRAVRWRLPLAVRQLLIELNDCKGCLTVHWREYTGEDIEAVVGAWDAEGEWQSEHWFANDLVFEAEFKEVGRG
jgi:hypothetical protein